MSSLCLRISYHRYVQVNQQADYTVTPSVLVRVISFTDQIISFKVAGEVLRNLAALGVLKLRSLLSSRFTDDTNSVRFVAAGTLSRI